MINNAISAPLPPVCVDCVMNTVQRTVTNADSAAVVLGFISTCLSCVGSPGAGAYPIIHQGRQAKYRQITIYTPTMHVIFGLWAETTAGSNQLETPGEKKKKKLLINLCLSSPITRQNVRFACFADVTFVHYFIPDTMVRRKSCFG